MTGPWPARPTRAGTVTGYAYTYATTGPPALTTVTTDHPAPRGDETVTYDNVGRRRFGIHG